MLTSKKTMPMTSVTPITGWKSWVTMALVAYRPMPGQSNTVSTSTVPPSSQPKYSPITVRLAVIAFLSTYLKRIRRCDRPSARSVST